MIAESGEEKVEKKEISNDQPLQYQTKLTFEIPIICSGHSRPVVNVSFSKMTPEGYFLASSCLDGEPMIREGATGDWVGTFFGHKGAVWCNRFNPDATQAVTASADFSVKLWDALTGDALHTFQQKHIARAAIFSANSKSIYTGGAEKKLRIYSLENIDAEPTVFEGPKPISQLEICGDPNLILSASKEESVVRVWDIRTGKNESELKHSKPMTCVQLCQGGSVLVTSSGSSVAFWDAKTLKQTKSFRLTRDVQCVSYHPDAGIFVTGSSDLLARTHSYETGEVIGVHRGHHGPVNSIDFSPLADRFATGSVDGTIRLWEFSKAQDVAPKESVPPLS